LLKAAFLDRDGVINDDKGYVHRPEDFVFLDGALEGLRELQKQGYRLIVVTNQSGIGRGYFSEKEFEALTSHMIAALGQSGVTLAGVYHCPHVPAERTADACDCRKPAPGMILRAQGELGIDLSRSILCGDKDSDLGAGRAAGVGRIFRIGKSDKTPGSFASLWDVAEHLRQQQTQKKGA